MKVFLQYKQKIVYTRGNATCVNPLQHGSYPILMKCLHNIRHHEDSKTPLLLFLPMTYDKTYNIKIAKKNINCVYELIFINPLVKGRAIVWYDDTIIF